MTWVVLLRAVNVGGTGKLLMAELRAALEQAGAGDVASYIQSGNLIFTLAQDDPRRVENWVGDVIETRFGFRPGVMAFSGDDLTRALARDPWPGVGDPKYTLLSFFTGVPDDTAMEVLAQYCTAGEQIVLGERCLYVRYPNGSGTSKLTSRIEPALGCPATARNLNTVRKIHAML